MNNDQGIALLMVLVVLLCLGLIVGVIGLQAYLNVNLSRNVLENKKAIYAAEAGIEMSNYLLNTEEFTEKTYSKTLSNQSSFELLIQQNKEIMYIISTGEFNNKEYVIEKTKLKIQEE